MPAVHENFLLLRTQHWIWGLKNAGTQEKEGFSLVLYLATLDW